MLDDFGDVYPSSSRAVYIWKQAPHCQYIRQLDPWWLWFQTYRELKDEGLFDTIYERCQGGKTRIREVFLRSCLQVETF